MKILIFGIGKYYQKRKDYFKDVEIIAFIDNNLLFQGQYCDGKPIISPNKIKEYEFSYIMLMSKYRNDMRNQLVSLGVPEEKIIDFSQIGLVKEYRQTTIYYKNSYYDINRNTGAKILMISHELTNTGAPIVLYYAATLLKKCGYQPYIICTQDGDLRKDIVASGIPVIIEEYISRYNILIWEWIMTFDLVFVNTLPLYHIINELNDVKKPVIWWMHEGDITYDLLGKDNLPKLSKNINPFAVGNLAISSYKKYYGNDNIQNLLYGIPDRFTYQTNIDFNIKRKIIFAMIGTISARKAQDIFAEAIQILSKEEREQAEFWIIGENIEPEIYRLIENSSKLIPQLKILGAHDHEELLKMYSEIDVLVCPSRNDPMPVVLTEAMMYQKVCIASDMTGTASLIDHKKNGFICKAEDAFDLSNQMKWILQNKDSLQQIGKSARKLFQELFSMNAFEENLIRILDNLLLK